jgi:hypothetical protein
MAISKLFQKIQVFLSAIFFLVAILTITYHYESYAFRLADCSICNFKKSTSFSIQKVKNDPLSALILFRPWLKDDLPALHEIFLTDGPVYIPSLFSYSLCNKAPPIFS